MKRTLSVATGVAALAVWMTATALAGQAGAAGAVMTSTKTAGQVSIVPEPKLVNGELILKVVALNESQQPATFGPEDIVVTTADGKPVALMSLAALIARAKDEAGDSGDSHDYNMPGGMSGPVVTQNMAGQPNVSNYAGGTSMSGSMGATAPAQSSGGSANNAALQAQIAGLKAGILQDVTVAPGEVKGGEVVTQRIKFHWREKHTLHIEVRFNGEQHEFDLPALPED